MLSKTTCLNFTFYFVNLSFHYNNYQTFLPYKINTFFSVIRVTRHFTIAIVLRYRSRTKITSLM